MRVLNQLWALLTLTKVKFLPVDWHCAQERGVGHHIQLAVNDVLNASDGFLPAPCR